MGLFGLTAGEQRLWGKIKVGDRADIILPADYHQLYPTKVAEVREEELCLHTPRQGSSVLEIDAKVNVVINVYTDEGVFRFKGKVTNQDWQRGYIITIAKPRSIERIQQRCYFRLPVLLPVEFGVLTGVESVLGGYDNPVFNGVGVTKNISEGGILLVIDKPLTVGTVMKVKIHIDERTAATAIGNVLEQKRSDVPDKLITRLQFTRIADSDKDRIKRLILSRTRT